MKNKNGCRKFTEKDLLYLEDMFSWNMQALKLVNHFMNEVENEEVSEVLEGVFDMHYENLNKCISILEGNHQEEYEEEECEKGHHEKCDCSECCCSDDEEDEEDE